MTIEKTRKTVAASSAPRDLLASFCLLSWRASAPFALLNDEPARGEFGPHLIEFVGCGLLFEPGREIVHAGFESHSRFITENRARKLNIREAVADVAHAVAAGNLGLNVLAEDLCECDSDFANG